MASLGRPQNKFQQLIDTPKNFVLSFLPPQLMPLYYTIPPEDSIRLLKLHPGTTGQDIQCSLIPVRLDEEVPSYEAISYVWSLKEGERSIICNGHRNVKVTTNLFEALERLRDSRYPRLVWCDSLCIHQSNPVEKGLQVRLMHRIYSLATRVLVWLGTDDYDEAHYAFGLLCTLVNAESPSAKSVIYETIDQNQRPIIMDVAPPPQSRKWIYLQALFINPWFVRMWVLQEIVLARSATFIWGSASISWDIIAKSIDVIRSQPYLHANLETRHLQNAFFMHHLRGLEPSELKTAHPFLHLLDWSRNFDVSDPKDKVFGLLGFPTRDAECGSARDEAVFMEPDYDRSVAEIYTEVARKIIEKERSLDVLSYTVHVSNAEFQNGEEEVEGIPSWVPDWSGKTIIYPFGGTRKEEWHKAGTAREIEIVPTAYPEILCLKGVEVDVIKETLGLVPFTSLAKATKGLKRLIKWCFANTNHPAFTLADVLSGGRNVHGKMIRGEQQHLADFCALLQELDPKWLVDGWPEEAESLKTLAENQGDPDLAREAVWRYTCYRSPFMTRSGKLGLGPGATKSGDVVVVLWGGQLPFVLRKKHGHPSYHFVGECYLDSFTDGEEVNRLMEENGKISQQIFELR